MKQCKTCGQKKPLTDYYKHNATIDLLRHDCKNCMLEAARRRIAANPEAHYAYHRAYDRARSKLPEERERKRLAARRHRQTNPKKSRARDALRYAVSRGYITKESCWCGETNVQGHHPNYNNPLFVVWLCRKHHMEIHRGKKKMDSPANS